jgi:hypothetical protein
MNGYIRRITSTTFIYDTPSTPSENLLHLWRLRTSEGLTLQMRSGRLISCSRHSKPGGWVEFQELHYYPHCDDDSMNRPYAFRDFLENVRDGVANMGSDLNGVTRLRGQMEDAGFINIEEHILRCPIGIWPKDKTLKLAGLYWRTAISDGLMNVAKRPMEKGLGWTMAQVEVFLVGVRKALIDSSFHSYMYVCWHLSYTLIPMFGADNCHRPLHMLYGQKPFKSKTEPSSSAEPVVES